jgi:hypothetical protein
LDQYHWRRWDDRSASPSVAACVGENRLNARPENAWSDVGDLDVLSTAVE